MAFAPIERTLEHEDSNARVTMVFGVDITPHILAAFPTTAEAVSAMNSEDELVEALCIAFEQDPSLVDDDGQHRSWVLFETSLRDMLFESMGEVDHGDETDAEVWERWSLGVRQDGAGERHLETMAAGMLKAIDEVLTQYEHQLSGDTLAVVARHLLVREGGIAALRTAVERYDGPDAVGVLRLAGSLRPA